MDIDEATLARLRRVAEWMKDCKRCNGTGIMVIGPFLPGGQAVSCTDCYGTGTVTVIKGLSRECPVQRRRVASCEYCLDIAIDHCPTHCDCHGTKRVPVSEILAAVRDAGIRLRLTQCTVGDMVERWTGDGTDARGEFKILVYESDLIRATAAVALALTRLADSTEVG